jgi:hypothetical protein
MKILYIDHGNVVRDNYMYQYYGDLYRELKKVADVHLYEKPVRNFTKVNDSDIDCVMFGLGYFTQTNIEAYSLLKGLADVKVPVVCLLHKPQTMLEEKLNFCKINNIDILMDTNITYKEYGESVGAKAIRFWFTADPSVYYPREVTKLYDFGFSGADHGGAKIKGPANNLRNRVRKLLSQTDKNVFWNSTRDLSYRIQSVEEYATKMSECKIWLATTGPNNDISPRYFEVMLSKTLLFCNDMSYQYEGLFIDGVNCVTFKNDLSDFNQKLEYYLSNEDEMEKIIKNAYDMVIENYTWEHMARKLIKEVEELQCPSK